MLFAVVFGLFAVAHSLPAIYQFNSWKQAHGKIYQPEEEVKRMEIFMNNLKFIEEFNTRKDRTMTLGLNKFADLTNEEFRTLMTGSVNATKELQGWFDKEASTFMPPANFEAPSSVDWRNKGYVTDVKDQGQCGSCWAFSSTGSIEGQWFRKSGSLVSLSEQQLLDCSTAYGNQGCNGGLMANSFAYVQDNGGIDTEVAYPYEAMLNYCRYQTSYVGARVTGYVNVSPYESYLQQAVASIGPISIAIDASQQSFQFYTSGIYSEPYCSSVYLDHAVLAVGYGTSDEGDYWIVKNSWGEMWGESGYIKMARNSGNMCGVASMASYPLV